VLPATPVVGSVAVTVIVPTALPDVVVRRPELEMLTPVALDGLKLHVTELVIGTDCPLAVPVATNCWGFPDTIVGFVGVTVIAVRFAIVTVIVAVPVWVPDAPVIVEVPGETPVTNPVELFTVATDWVSLLQKIPLVNVLVEPSL
jgi:hypothetical protein